MSDPSGNILIIGAGPAGLTAAYALMKAGRTGTVIEADSVVGGIARTVERDGYRFSSMVIGVITSAPFQMRIKPAAEPVAARAAR